MALMENHIEINKQNIVNLLLDKAAFTSFWFGCNFSLIFECNRIENKKLPFSIRLSIEGDWWFGDEGEWKKIVEEMTAGQGYVEPSEPVLAFKLAALRWSDGSIIQKVNLSENKLLISFDSGETISISNHGDYDCECVWEIVECEYKNDVPNDYWWVSCDTSGNIDYNIPMY